MRVLEMEFGRKECENMKRRVCVMDCEKMSFGEIA